MSQGAFFTNPIPVLSAKSPDDNSVWSLDFSNTVGPNDRLAGVVSVTAEPPDLAINGFTLIPGIGGPFKAVGIGLSGGTNGETYLVTCEVLTVAGHTYARSIYLPVLVR